MARLSSLFGVLLKERSWLLHQHALEAFSQFAEVQQVLNSCYKCLESRSPVFASTSLCCFCIWGHKPRRGHFSEFMRWGNQDKGGRLSQQGNRRLGGLIIEKRLTCDLNSCGAFLFADGECSGRGGAAAAEDQTGGSAYRGTQREAGEPERERFERRGGNHCSGSRGLWFHRDN